MSRKILIVDDSKTVRDVLKDTLLKAGYDVCDAAGGQDALDLVGDKDYDLLMTDLNMPEMDGFEFISEVRKIPGRRFLPIVVLSSEEKQKRFVDCVKAGASGFLQKPVDREQVLAILQTVIPY
jgi:two-component system chemotaxis response regulator CheY